MINFGSRLTESGYAVFFLQKAFRDLWRMSLEAGKLIPIDSSMEMMTYKPCFDCGLVSQDSLAVKTNQPGLF